LSSYTPPSTNLYPPAIANQEGTAFLNWLSHPAAKKWLVFVAAVLLVSVPIFVQAPLVRLFPWFSLVATVVWLGISGLLWVRPTTRVWGDLLFGFSLTWLAGSIYWGWLRWEPLWHLPIEAIGLPFAVFCLARQWGKVGNWFYLGSLFGTVLTDVYFYLVNLIPHWRQLMQVDPQLAKPIFQAAVAQMQTPWGAGCAVALVAILLTVGSLPLRSSQLHWWAFAGAVLSTLFVDGLFWVAATTA
jgi:Protein of unknown function (DUF3120)